MMSTSKPITCSGLAGSSYTYGFAALDVAAPRDLAARADLRERAATTRVARRALRGGEHDADEHDDPQH